VAFNFSHTTSSFYFFSNFHFLVTQRLLTVLLPHSFYCSHSSNSEIATGLMTNQPLSSGVLQGTPKQHRHEEEFKQLFPHLKEDTLIEGKFCQSSSWAVAFQKIVSFNFIHHIKMIIFEKIHFFCYFVFSCLISWEIKSLSHFCLHLIIPNQKISIGATLSQLLFLPRLFLCSSNTRNNPRTDVYFWQTHCLLFNNLF
jgi:hypothetical protein